MTKLDFLINFFFIVVVLIALCGLFFVMGRKYEHDNTGDNAPPKQKPKPFTHDQKRQPPQRPPSKPERITP